MSACTQDSAFTFYKVSSKSAGNAEVQRNIPRTDTTSWQEVAHEQRFVDIRQKEIFPPVHPLGATQKDTMERGGGRGNELKCHSLGSQQLIKQAKSIHFIDEPTKVEKPECPAPNHRH